MKNKQEIRYKIETLSKDSDPDFEINTSDVLEAYKHLDENRSNITIKILSILGVIISVISFLAALYSLHLLDDKLNLIIGGSIFLILSLWCIKKYNTIIIDTASIALYVVGICMLIYGLDVDHINNILVLCLIINLGTLLIVQRYLLSLLNLLSIIYSIIALVSKNSDNLIFIAFINIIIVAALLYMFSREALVLSKRNIITTIYNPLRIALILSAIATTIFIILAHDEIDEERFNASTIALYALSIAHSIAIIYMVYKISRSFAITKSKLYIPIYVLILITLGTTVINPGISGSILLILLCFYYQYKFGLSIALIALLFFLWLFYYNLNFSLLIKSVILIISGLLFLAIYFVINSNKTSNEKI